MGIIELNVMQGCAFTDGPCNPSWLKSEVRTQRFKEGGKSWQNQQGHSLIEVLLWLG